MLLMELRDRRGVISRVWRHPPLGEGVVGKARGIYPTRNGICPTFVPFFCLLHSAPSITVTLHLPISLSNYPIIRSRMKLKIARELAI